MVQLNLEDDHGRDLGKAESFLMSQMDSGAIGQFLTQGVGAVAKDLKAKIQRTLSRNCLSTQMGIRKGIVTYLISLYLGIADTKTPPPGWEVNVSFKLFVFDHIRDRYLTIQDGEGGIRRFHRMKMEWGFDKFIPLEIFNHASNGYLLEDCCVFGAEVFVVKHNGKGECVMTMKNPLNNTYTWKIDNVSKLDGEVVLSEAFIVGEHKWKLVIYPKGNGTAKDKSVSVFLKLDDWETLLPGWKVYAEYKLWIRDEFQILGTNMQKQVLQHWFCASSKSYGYPEYMALSDPNIKRLPIA
ncbi:uncharacterized protein LOC131307158 [Rhododendron vialii]|uniref:uncharacterized protein LOC131307158 n=1 Tax=Rhododendron vialii TaxID=182163 RepID=UPI0026600A28|nr:uncharacterized protein LOC131307158 [Rhododendron vialii]